MRISQKQVLEAPDSHSCMSKPCIRCLYCDIVDTVDTVEIREWIWEDPTEDEVRMAALFELEARR